MTIRAIALTLAVALGAASGVGAQETPKQLTGPQAELAAAVDSLTQALIVGDLEAIKQAIHFPLIAGIVAGTEAVRVEEATEDLLTQEAVAAAVARYGLAKQAQLVEPTVELLAANVAVLAAPIQWVSEAGNVLMEDRIAGLFVKDAGGWRLSAVIMGAVQALEPDEATRQQIDALTNGVVKAVVQQKQDDYMAAFSLPVIHIEPELGARRLGYNELQAQYRQLTYMVMDVGLADAAVSVRHLFMLGPNAACAIEMAKGFDGAGAQIGYRPQAALLVKEAGKWKIVAQAVGTPEEGIAPEQ